MSRDIAGRHCPAAAASALDTSARGAEVRQDPLAAFMTEKPILKGFSMSDAATEHHAALSKALKSVVKIFTTVASPNHSAPWQMQPQSKCTATGFAISPLGQRRILTNAHAVCDQLAVLVRKHGDARKFNAKVLAVGHECDIAMLTVEDEEFWKDVEALEIDGLPDMQESVLVVGFPQGGDNVCVTKGVVSRIDRQQYSHGRTTLLTLQIDAAINSGNSGGPVVKGDKVVGIAFQCLTVGENIGYIIPVPVMEHFLEDLKRNGGQYTGFCQLGANWQLLENPDMKKYLGMPKGMTGVYVTKLEPLFHASKVLQVGDVITHFNSHVIADDGTFLYEGGSRIDFRHLVSMAFHGDMCKLKVWRNNEHLDVVVELSTPKYLVPIHSHDVKPTYYIYAGFVFVKLTSFYLKSWYGADWGCKAPIRLCDKALLASMDHEGQEVVVLSKVLAADINQGYQDVSNSQVLSVNGVKVHCVAHLCQLLENLDDEYAKIELESKRVLVINHKEARKANATILKQNAISDGFSAGLLQEVVCVPSPDDRSNTPNMDDLREHDEAVAVGTVHWKCADSKL